MFVPRQIQKKAAPPKRPASTVVFNTTQSLQALLPLPPKKIETEKFNVKLCASDDISLVAARETVMALEMLLSDFSMGHVYGDWLSERMREVEGKDDCELEKGSIGEFVG